MKLQEKSDRRLGSWEEVHRKARKCDRMKLEKEKEEGELERVGQPVCIYEIYSGPAAWPFLHHGALYRGLSLVSFSHPKLSADIFLLVLI